MRFFLPIFLSIYFLFFPPISLYFKNLFKSCGFYIREILKPCSLVLCFSNNYTYFERKKGENILS